MLKDSKQLILAQTGFKAVIALQGMKADFNRNTASVIEK